MAIRIIIADDVSEMREMIAKMLEMSGLDCEIIGSCENGQEVVDLLERKPANIVLMDINMPIMNGLEATEIITNRYPNVNVIIMSVQHESEYLKKAMFAGAKAYIMKPVDMDELVDTIKTTFSRYQANVPVKTVEIPTHEAKLISFFSGKGGSGTSFVALNSAITISNKFNKAVLLVDVDLRFGDISLMLNRQSDLTIQNLLDDTDLDDMESIRPYIYKMKNGPDVIFAPKTPEAAEYIPKNKLEKLLELVKGHYDYIIFDLGINFDDVTLTILDVTDRVYIVSTQEVTGLKDTKLSIKVMETLNYTPDKVKLIINMSDDRFGVTKATVQKAFDYEVVGYIPEETKLVRHSINTGEPIALSKNGLTKPFVSLCQKMTEA